MKQVRMDAPHGHLIAIVGLAGTGKSTVVEILKQLLNATAVYFGGVVVDEVVRRELTVNEQNERHVREEMRKNLGMAAIAKYATHNIDTALSSSTSCVLDGLYSWAEYEYLQDKYAGGVVLLAVHADRPVREQRLATRPVRPLTKEMVLDRDMREVRHLDKAAPIALADYHLVNNGALGALERNLQQLFLPLLQVTDDVASK